MRTDERETGLDGGGPIPTRVVDDDVDPHDDDYGEHGSPNPPRYVD